MEVEEPVNQPNGAEAAGSTENNHTEDPIGNLINECKEESIQNKDDLADDLAKAELAEEKKKIPVKEVLDDDKTSKRVREGQRWNNRSTKYSNKHDRASFKRNYKSDLTSQAESSDPVAIRKQVEFYFSDSNLLQDKFLFTKVEGHENSPVPISLIHSFKRMRHFQPLSAVVDALKESTTLDVVDDDTCIQRKEPLPEGLVGKPMVEIQKVHEDQSMARSIYAKGFGDEEPSTQFDIEAFFASHGPTNSVRLRRTYQQSFKGSVFVEFDSEETQKSFLALDPQPKWRGKELLIKSKKQYCDDKVEDIKAGKVRPNEDDDRGWSNFKRSFKRHRDSPDYEKGEKKDGDDRDWRVRREDDRKSGFRGKHRGQGSSGRGRGGRNDRGGRKDRNEEREKKNERGVPKVKATTPDSGDEAIPTPTKAAKADDQVVNPNENANEPTATSVSSSPAVAGAAEKEHLTPVEANSKKRAREEDEAPEGEGSAKKVDTKDAES